MNNIFIKAISQPMLKATTTIRQLALCVLISCVFSQHSMAMEMLDEVVAIANDGVIMRSELDQRIAELRTTIKDTDPQASAKIEKIALEQLIIETIQLQLAKRAQLKVSDEELNVLLQNIAQRQQKSIAQLRQTIEAQGQKWSSFIDKLRREALINRVQHGSLHNKLQISDLEIANYLQSTHGKDISATQYRLLNILLEGGTTPDNQAFLRRLRNSLLKGEVSLRAIIKKQRFDDRAIKVSDMGWLAEEAIPAKFKSTALALKPRDISQPIATDNGYSILLLIDKQGLKEVMVTQYLARHILIKKTDIRSPIAAKELIENIRKRALNGEDFASLAKLFSDDEGSASSGGELGWATADIFVPEFGNALAGLKKNEISPVIKTKFGWHIIQLLDTREHNISEDMLRNKARQAIYEHKFQDAREKWLSEIRNDAYIEIKK